MSLQAKKNKSTSSSLAETEQGRVKAAQRALSLLKAFSASRHTLNLKQISEMVDLDGATTLRMVNTLMDEGLIYRNGDNYSLGFKVLELAQVCLARFDVCEIALPYLRSIKAEIDETTMLCVQSGNYRVPVSQVESSKPYRRTGGIGKPTLLHTGAPGRILLAYCDEAFVDAYINEVIDRTKTLDAFNEKKFRRGLDLARKSGFTESENEVGLGGAAVAAPIIDYHGNVVASLALAAPATRWSLVRKDATRLIVEGARSVSKELGFEVGAGMKSSRPLAKKVVVG